MVNKKFKRYDVLAFMHNGWPSIELLTSALSLRLFGEDIAEGSAKLNTKDLQIDPAHSTEVEPMEESVEAAE